MGGRIGRAFRVKEEEGLGMETHAEHYERLLGLDGDWQVLDVELVLEEQRVAGAEFYCPSAQRSVRFFKQALKGNDIY